VFPTEGYEYYAPEFKGTSRPIQLRVRE